MASLVDGAMVPSLQLGTPHMATIMILDDDHSGVFQFQVKFREISVIFIFQSKTYGKC